MLKLLRRTYRYYQWLQECSKGHVYSVTSPEWSLQYVRYVTSQALAHLNVKQGNTEALLKIARTELMDGLDVVEEAMKWIQHERDLATSKVTEVDVTAEMEADAEADAAKHMTKNPLDFLR